MASLLSAEASAQAHGHLHLDPTLELQVPVKSKCESCCPGASFLKKLLCCCSSNCCNKTVQRDVVIYCDSKGLCKEFDPEKSSNHLEDYKKTAERVKSLVEVEKLKRGSQIRKETGIDLEAKSARGEPIKLDELKRIQAI
jgi:hypothetical protein